MSPAEIFAGDINLCAYVHIGFAQKVYKLEFAELFGEWCAVSMRYTARAPLSKGSCHQVSRLVTEGL